MDTSGTVESMDFDGGKYTVINDNGILKALRNGEPWARDLAGDKLLYAMFCEARNLKERCDALVREVQGSVQEVKSAKDSRSVSLAETTLTFSLPNDFGVGWEYRNVHLYGQHHEFAGSYNRSVTGNFAHEALLQLPEVTSAYLSAGMVCNVDVKVNAISEASAIQSRLLAVVDAFAARDERQISVRGSNFNDSTVTEYDANDPETEIVSDMPYLSYLAKYVPLAESLPALSGHDLDALRAQADEHQQAAQVAQDDSSRVEVGVPTGG